MRQIIVLVGGRTEEALVGEALAPAALVRDVVLRSTVVTTSATPTGNHRGGGGWKHHDRALPRLRRVVDGHPVVTSGRRSREGGIAPTAVGREVQERPPRAGRGGEP